MSADRVTYLDSSAIVKLVVPEPESAALRRYVRRRHGITSALARTEVVRAVLPLGAAFTRRADELLDDIELVRIGDRVLRAAAALPSSSLRSLDAIHLATALLLGDDVGRLVTYDERMAVAATELGLAVAAPA